MLHCLHRPRASGFLVRWEGEREAERGPRPMMIIPRRPAAAAGLPRATFPYYYGCCISYLRMQAWYCGRGRGKRCRRGGGLAASIIQMRTGHSRPRPGYGYCTYLCILLHFAHQRKTLSLCATVATTMILHWACNASPQNAELLVSDRRCTAPGDEDGRARINPPWFSPWQTRLRPLPTLGCDTFCLCTSLPL